MGTQNENHIPQGINEESSSQTIRTVVDDASDIKESTTMKKPEIKVASDYTEKVITNSVPNRSCTIKRQNLLFNWNRKENKSISYDEVMAPT